MGLIDIEKTNYQAALPGIQKAVELAHEIKSKDLQSQTLATLSQIYKQLGDFENAFLSLNESQRVEKNIYNEDIVNRMGILKVQQARREDTIYKDLYNRIKAISQMGQEITATFNIREIGNVIHKGIKDLLSADSLSVGIRTPGKKEISYKIRISDGKFQKEHKCHFDIEEHCLKRCFVENKTISINNLARQSKEDRKLFLSYGILTNTETNSLLLAPLVVGKETFGILTIQSKKINAYHPYHIDIVQAMAAYIAIALVNEKLFSNTNQLANTDSLTGILNRRQILIKAKEEFIKHHEKNTPLSVAMIDLDKFKAINDIYGHTTGDEVLKDVAKLLTEKTRAGDLPGRLGGDEFLLLLPQTNIQQAGKIAERLTGYTFESSSLGKTINIPVTISIGLAEVEPEDLSITDTINRADQNLYKAKSKGGKRVG